MSSQAQLRGITWDHERGYAPVEATARTFCAARQDVEITWDRRTLQEFADFPIDQLMERYDLLVVDHPHVGDVARAQLLLPMDEPRYGDQLAQLAAQSVGESFESYRWDGRIWALPIDAASQVSAYRADRLKTPPRMWSEVIELARAGRVLWPTKPVDSLMSYFTLSANLGKPCAVGKDRLQEREVGLRVLAAMKELADLLPRECLAMNPPQTLDRLAEVDSPYDYCPLLYGYSNYSRPGYRASVVNFCNIPGLESDSCRGSTLGGTGIAISAKTKQRELALEYAYWIASAECQRGEYFVSGGQPANAVAWDDDGVNRQSANFFRDTRATLDAAWVRPRYAGYLSLQDEGGTAINRYLRGEISAPNAYDELESSYHRSL